MAVVAGATTSLIRRGPLPPLIPCRYSKKKATSPPRVSPLRLPKIGMDSTDNTTASSESEVNIVESIQNRTLFVCGFVSKRWHNNSLQAVIQDLIPHYYVACNDDSVTEHAKTRELLSHADALIFFVNEFTLGDPNCLLTLQYAWHLMVPVIMLRPPRTKLVICKRSNRKRDDMRVVGNGSIIRSPTARWTLVDNDSVESVDYALLQDILYEGYKLSVVYDRLEHNRSMGKIRERINSVLKPSSFDVESQDKVGFYLSPSNDSSNSVTITSQSNVRSKIKSNMSKKNKAKEKEKRQEIRLSMSLNNLEGQKTRARVPGTPRKPKELPIQFPLSNNTSDDEKPEESEKSSPDSPENTPREKTSRMEEDIQNGNGEVDPEPEAVEEHPEPPKPPAKKQVTVTSRQSTMERRMSLSSLDDRRNFTSTQYLIFPMRDPTKKPKLIKFPEDVLEEDWHDDSIWGSDTSLEEEAQIAPQINAGFSIDEEEDRLSPSYSPTLAPYIDPL